MFIQRNFYKGGYSLLLFDFNITVFSSLKITVYAVSETFNYNQLNGSNIKKA